MSSVPDIGIGEHLRISFIDIPVRARRMHTLAVRFISHRRPVQKKGVVMTTGNATWLHRLRDGFLPPSVSGKPIHEAVASIQEAVETHVMGSQPVQSYLEGLPKGPGTNCPDSPMPEILKYVAQQRGLIDKSDPRVRLRFVAELAMPAMAFERAEVLRVLLDHPDLTDEDRDLVHLADDLAPLHDQLWAAWFARVCVPFQECPDTKREVLRKALTSQLPVFDYTAFDLDGNTVVNRQTLAMAFPEVIGGIHKAICARVFGSLELARYFRALDAAYTCTEIDKLEKRWREVDITWVQLPQTIRFLPVHGFESGYGHPCCVNLEFMLSIRTPIFAKEIAAYREGALRWVECLLIGEQGVLEAYRTKLDRQDVAVFVDAIRSGARADQRFAGQSLPNRGDVAVEFGGRSFLDPSAGRMFCVKYQEALRAVCTPRTADILVPVFDADSFLHHAAVHELFHPLARTVECDAALGTAKGLLEESKASSAGIASSLTQHSTSAWARYLLAHYVARVARFFKTVVLTDESRASYVRENSSVTTTLFQSGLIRMTPEGIDLNDAMLEDGTWIRWPEELEIFVAGVVDAYVDHGAAALETLTTEYCSRGDETLLGQIIVLTNRS